MVKGGFLCAGLAALLLCSPVLAADGSDKADKKDGEAKSDRNTARSEDVQGKEQGAKKAAGDVKRDLGGAKDAAQAEKALESGQHPPLDEGEAKSDEAVADKLKATLDGGLKKKVLQKSKTADKPLKSAAASQGLAPSAPAEPYFPAAAGEHAPGSGAQPLVEGSSSTVESFGSMAVQKARKIEESLRQGFQAPEDMPSGNDLGPRPDQGAGQSGSSPKPGQLQSPATKTDLVLAAASGFGASFAALDLRAASGPGGRPDIVRRDGSPASPAQLAQLSALIRSEPEALMRRPDFYSVIPRERFLELKEEYRAHPDLRETAFQDIALSESQRDFRMSASCSRVAGGCNPYTTLPFYKKGDFTAPEDLSRIWRAVNDESGSGSDLGEYTDEERRGREQADLAQEKLSRGVLGPGRSFGLLDSLRSAAASLFGGRTQTSSSEEAGAVAAGGSAGGAEPAAAEARQPLAGRRQARSQASVPSPESRGPRRRAAAWSAAAAAGAALLAAALWRRRQGGRPG